MLVAAWIIVLGCFSLGLLLAVIWVSELRAIARRKSWLPLQAHVIATKTESHLGMSDSLTPLQYNTRVFYEYTLDGINYRGECAGGLIGTAGSANGAMRKAGLPTKGSTVTVLVDPLAPRDSYLPSHARVSHVAMILMSGAFLLGSAVMAYLSWRLSRH
jgi:hypothetical protein